MYGQVHHVATGISPTPTPAGKGLYGGGLSGGPAPVTGARTRWHGMRSPVHKTLCRNAMYFSVNG